MRGGYVRGMWMKLFQLLAAFAGGSFAIYTGMENGYGVGLFAAGAAYLVTVGPLWIIDRVRRHSNDQPQ